MRISLLLNGASPRPDQTSRPFGDTASEIKAPPHLTAPTEIPFNAANETPQTNSALASLHNNNAAFLRLPADSLVRFPFSEPNCFHHIS